MTDPKQKEEFLEQFPVFQNVFDMPYLYDINLMGQGLHRSDKMHIAYEKATGELLFRSGKKFGFIDHQGNFSKTDPSCENHIYAQEEMLFSLDCEGKIIKTLRWPEANGNDDIPFFALGIFWDKNDFGEISQNFSIVQSLVWLTVIERREKLEQGMRNTFGLLRERTVHITVYTKPTNGFGALCREALEVFRVKHKS